MRETPKDRVEGCWANTTDFKKFPECRHCGTREVAVPKAGHINSHYWKFLQRPGKECLVCCPNNCLEIEGDATFHMSHTWTGMITPKGKMFAKKEFIMERVSIVGKTSYFEWPAEARGKDEDDLYDMGWMFVNHGHFTWKKPLTDDQKLYIHCFCFGRKIDEKQFKEDLKHPSGHVCPKNLYEED